MLVFQDPTRPNAVLDALVSLASPSVTRFRVVVAYTTLSGCEQLMPALESAIGGAWVEMPKLIITSFDYGITEPEALEYLATSGFEIRIANLGAGGRLVILPAASAFHPKAYLFDDEERVAGLIGSANLTRRALTLNVEVAYLVASLADAQTIDEQWWAAAVHASVPLTDELLLEYRERRVEALSQQRPQREPVRPLTPAVPGALKMFSEAILAGEVDPQEFTAFWVQADSMSGGSKSQLELPRRASAFFGFAVDYDDAQKTIGTPALVVDGVWFSGRKLAWHGGNRMERINLPTFQASGLQYSYAAIMFRRVDGGFALEVRPWDSAEALVWRDESDAAGHLYRVGPTRICGLL